MQSSFELDRFVEAQCGLYVPALAELHAGRKRSHWMWYVFPQLRGLGKSHNALRYGISGRAEAEAYLQHPVLGARLRECVAAIAVHSTRSAVEILGTVDALKFRSCLTLFEAVAPAPSDFGAALQQFYGGQRCERTLALLRA